MQSSDETDLVRSFDRLADLVEREEPTYVRILRADGSMIEGEVLGVGDDDLILFDAATRERMQVLAHELQSLDVSMPRRAREWMLAAVGIPAATAALVGFAQLPWVRPVADHIMVGFVILMAIVYGVVSIPPLGKWLRSLLTRWQRVYPP